MHWKQNVWDRESRTMIRRWCIYIRYQNTLPIIFKACHQDIHASKLIYIWLCTGQSSFKMALKSSPSVIQIWSIKIRKISTHSFCVVLFQILKKNQSLNVFEKKKWSPEMNDHDTKAFYWHQRPKHSAKRVFGVPSIYACIKIIPFLHVYWPKFL